MPGNRDIKKSSATYAYLDLLATTLTEHEKNLNVLIERLGEVTRELSKLIELEFMQARESKEPNRERKTYSDEETLEALLQAARGILPE